VDRRGKLGGKGKKKRESTHVLGRRDLRRKCIQQVRKGRPLLDAKEGRKRSSGRDGNAADGNEFDEEADQQEGSISRKKGKGGHLSLGGEKKRIRLPRRKKRESSYKKGEGATSSIFRLGKTLEKRCNFGEESIFFVKQLPDGPEKEKHFQRTSRREKCYARRKIPG